MKKLFILLLLVLFGCERNPYQLTKSDDGTIYRLNKRTGEMRIIKDNEVAPLETPKSKTVKKLREISEEKILEEPIEWGERQIPAKNFKFRLRTYWRENKLYYDFKAFPYSSLEKIIKEKKKQRYPRYDEQFIIKFLDVNSFIIKTIPTNLWDMTNVVDKDNKIVEKSINSKTECSKDDYSAILYYTVEWVLDTNLIPDEEKISDTLQEDLQLSGILWDSKSPNNSSAVINDKVCKVGNKIGEFRIKEIKKFSIIFERQGKEFEVKLAIEDNK